MMTKLKVLSGRAVVSIFIHFGFTVIGQRGSHAKLMRLVSGGRQVLTVPLHRELDAGTLKAIFRQALKYIPEAELQEHFYS